MTVFPEPLTLQTALVLIAELRAQVEWLTRTNEQQAKIIELQGKRIAEQDKRIAELEEKARAAFWTFVKVEGVEPTNNAAEQALRFAVLWRKMRYGTKPVVGSAVVARILTVHATLRQQGKSVHAFLRAACEAQRVGAAPPSLLPDSTI